MENLPRVFTRNFHGKQAELSRTAKLDKIMNVKPTISVIARIAPPVLIGVAIFLALKELFSGENKETKPETAPADAGRESCRNRLKPQRKSLYFTTFHLKSPSSPPLLFHLLRQKFLHRLHRSKSRVFHGKMWQMSSNAAHAH